MSEVLQVDLIMFGKNLELNICKCICQPLSKF